MNDDVYAEWLVARKSSPLRIPLMILMGAAVLVSLLLLFVNSWFSLLLVAVIIAVVFFSRYLKVEYEYTFITNELQIDAIYSQQMRKNKKKNEMSSIEYMEPTNEERNKNLLSGKTVQFEDFSSGEKGRETWTIRYSGGGKQNLLVFEPNEKMVRVMWRCAPNKVQMKR